MMRPCGLPSMEDNPHKTPVSACKRVNNKTSVKDQRARGTVYMHLANDVLKTLKVLLTQVSRWMVSI